MCMSAQASFTVAAALTTIGAYSIHKAQTPSMKLFACTPLFFALQQAAEGIVWLTFNQSLSTSAHAASIYLFLFFAGCFWPVWVPTVLYVLEKNEIRRKILFSCMIVGDIMALATATALVLYGVSATVADGHIQYIMPVGGAFASDLVNYLRFPLYLYATVVPLLIASTWRVWTIGLVIATGYFIAHTFFAVAFASMWCFIAALASALVYRVVVKHNETVLL